MLNFLKRLFTSEAKLHEEQKAHFESQGKYLQLKSGGYRVDIFEAPHPEDRTKTVHGYTINRE